MNLNLGLLIITIAFLGYFSNFLNGRYLNFFPINLLYYIGAIIHESSHALACVFTGAKIINFKVFSSQPFVSHTKSKIPILGQALISLAPIFGGALFLFLVNHFLLKDYIAINNINNFFDILKTPLTILSQIKIFDWQGIVIIFLFLNIGAMIGPSTQDLKNIWLPLIIFFFILSPMLTNFCLIIIGLIFTNIVIQLSLILISKIFRR